VIAYHAHGIIYGESAPGTRVSPWMAFVQAGHTGVDLFFLLSAFLLSRP
jgi:peptidoglycan/LPS O-acetylase OafA/YrhL